ncbi:MAG: HepT-like ribonuclease domain-containing protein [Chloroflexota bacterium]
MQRDPKAYLWDAREALDAIAVFTRGRTREDFQQNLLLRSAVERQFEIVGEALSQLARRDQALASQIPDLRQIVAFRNILIHGYAIVDSDRVWRVVHESLPELRGAVDRLLGDAPPGGGP